MVGPGLLAQVILNKFEYHLPLYRQEKMFRQQFGVELSRKTMGCWVEQAAELLKPVYRAIREDLLAGNYLQADETPIRYLDPDVKGKSQQGYLWTPAKPGGDVLFEWRLSRSREGPQEFLKDFRGKLQTDGYSVYESLAKSRGDLTLIGCYRRTYAGVFHEALTETNMANMVCGPDWTALCGGEETANCKGRSHDEAAMRVWQSRPVLARMRRAMEVAGARKRPPQGLLGRSIDYALKQWEALTGSWKRTAFEIDNNLIENSIQPSALEEEWLFVGHPDAGERSAVIYTPCWGVAGGMGSIHSIT